jgi:hypothetical protein
MSHIGLGSTDYDSVLFTEPLHDIWNLTRGHENIYFICIL